jgi:hypothetical protein
MARSVGIITCVSNANGYGPGHTALWIDGTVYSFEQMGSKNGWLVIKADEYADTAQNRGRPLVYYHLNERTSPNMVEEYLIGDAEGWSLYGPNVCSQRASLALNAGTLGGFDPKGYDTPFGVYWCAWRRKMVGEWWAVWKEPSLQSEAAQARITAKLRDDYQIELDDVYLG